MNASTAPTVNSSRPNILSSNVRRKLIISNCILFAMLIGVIARNRFVPAETPVSAESVVAGFAQTSEEAQSVITVAGRSDNDRNGNGRANDRSNPLSPFAGRLHSRRPPRQGGNTYNFTDRPSPLGGIVMWGVDLQMVQGVLNITCDDQNQRILIYGNPQGLLTITYTVVDHNGDEIITWATQVFPYENVDHIFVFLNEGNDTIINDTMIDCTVYAGPGNDLVVGGHSDDALYGEGGGDALFGGPGSDYIEGGGQSDLLCGGWPIDLIEISTLSFISENLNSEWLSGTYYVDFEVDTLRGGPDSAIDANWFLQEVLPDENEQAFENDVIVDYLEDFDWISFNDHFW